MHIQTIISRLGLLLALALTSGCVPDPSVRNLFAIQPTAPDDQFKRDCKHIEMDLSDSRGAGEPDRLPWCVPQAAQYQGGSGHDAL